MCIPEWHVCKYQKHINWIDLGQDMFVDLKIYDSHETKVKSNSFIQLD